MRNLKNTLKKLLVWLCSCLNLPVAALLNVTLFVLLYRMFQTTAKASPWRSGSCIRTTILIQAYPSHRSKAHYLISAYSAHTVRSTLSCSCRPCLHKIKQVRGSGVHAIIHAGASVHGRLAERGGESKGKNGFLFSDTGNAPWCGLSHLNFSSDKKRCFLSLSFFLSLSLSLWGLTVHPHIWPVRENEGRMGRLYLFKWRTLRFGWSWSDSEKDTRHLWPQTRAPALKGGGRRGDDEWREVTGKQIQCHILLLSSLHNMAF